MAKTMAIDFVIEMLSDFNPSLLRISGTIMTMTMGSRQAVKISTISVTIDTTIQ